MLGARIDDPDGVEASAGTSVPGLGLLPIMTTFAGEKRTVRASGRALATAGPWAGVAGTPVEGYEIHMGRTTGLDGHAPGLAPFLELDGHLDGAIDAYGRVAGTYLHGLFHNEALRHGLLVGLGRPADATAATFDREREFDRLAHHVRAHLDLEPVREWLGLRVPAAAS
jgi:adenosylcobyric acid synthase